MFSCVTINGRTLAEFHAKMHAYPQISSCDIDVEIFQGADRSSIQLLQNRRGGRHLTCRIDFIDPDNAVRTQYQSEFEAMFLGRCPAILDIGDGYFYRAVLMSVKEGGTEGELITTVEYCFRVTRHRDVVCISLVPNAAAMYCLSNVAKTDCVIRVPSAHIFGAPDLTVWLNGASWHYSPEIGGDMVLDGVNKIFTVGGKNVTNRMEWENFPYLVPGANRITVSTAGVVLSSAVEIAYTPTFL